MKERIILLCLALALLLSGCSTQKGSTAGTASDPVQKTLLYVAYPKSNPSASAIVDNFHSDTVELVPIILSAADGFDDYLLHNNYPADVYLIPNTTQISMQGYALGEKVGDLTSLLPEIIGDAEYYPVLDAGLIDGIQAFLPLRFQVPYFLTTRSQLTENGISLPEEYSMSMFIREFCRFGAACGDGTAAVYCGQQEAGIGAALYDAVRMSGVWNADPSSLDALICESVLKEYARYIKTAWEQTERAKGLYTYDVSYLYDPDPIYANANITLVRSVGCIPEALTVYDASCKSYIRDDAVLLSIPQYETPDAVTADVVLYAAIAPHTEKQHAICEFLDHAFHTPTGQGSDCGLSVSREAVQSYLDELCCQPEKVYAAGPVALRVPAMTEELRRTCEEALGRIVSGSIRNAYWERVFSAAMADFADGSVSFDDCLGTLIQRLYEIPDENGVGLLELSLPELLNQEILTEELYTSFHARIRQLPWRTISNGAFTSSGKTYFGTFNHGVIMRNGDSLLDTFITYRFGRVSITGGDSTDIFYRYGVFFDLEDAYARGLLSEEDIGAFAERFMQYH